MASAETRKAKSRLKVLSSSLTEIEAAIAPLLSGERTLPEILLALEPLEQAKLQTTLPYLVYDLIFIYLRTRGIDPKTHPVVTELERVRQYFEKIKNAENTPIRGTQVDKAAANRFIKHAISQAQIDADAAGVAYPPKASSSTTRLTPASNSAGVNSSESFASSAARVPVKVTSKMLERQEWQKRVDEAESEEGEEEEEEEEDIEGWEEGDGVREDEDLEVKTKSISKGKGKAVESLDDTERLGSKRRRPAIDPFEASGFIDSDNPSDSHPTKKQAILPRTRTSFTANPSSSSSSSSSSTSTTVDSPSTPATEAEEKKKRRKDKKKKKQKAAIKELKAPDRAGRIVELLAEVAASQGAVVASSSESGED
ncbi:Sas10/Utp3/C1D family-domain-containing protein [Lentinula edodes]|nr:Sas10/Utp3/C1D family-domain-containing protein [Lentinula edodes]